MLIKKITSEPTPQVSRRQFIKTSIIGASVLSSIHLTACTSNAIKSPFHQHKLSPYKFLTREDVLMLNAIFPAMIGAKWPKNLSDKISAETDLLARMDEFLSRLGQFNLNEVRKLFDLLQFTPARGLTTGIWKDWSHTNAQDVEHFLQRWKHSSISLFNSGYNALSDIICFAWYSNPVNTRYAGYTGPPKHALEGLPQFQSTSI